MSYTIRESSLSAVTPAGRKPTSNRWHKLDRKWPPSTGVLLVGHGTREPRGVEAFFTLAAEVSRRLAGLTLEPSFLELSEPEIAVGLNRLVARGVNRVVVAPLMLFAAGHVHHDIPAAVDQAARRHRDLEVHFARHLGYDRRVAALSRRRASESLGGGPTASEATALVLIGRGSRDARATAEMHRFAARRGMDGAAEVHVGFLAMARPRLPETLAMVAQRPVRRVVVQPHLLFPGRLSEEVEAQVRAAAEAATDRRWYCSGVLGPDSLVAEAVCTRVRRAVAAMARIEPSH